MWANHRADKVMCGANGGHPVAQGLIDGVLEGAAAAGHRCYLGAEEFHAKDVERLTFDILLAHIDLAFEPEYRGRGGRGHAVLSGTGLGDDAPFPHSLRQ